GSCCSPGTARRRAAWCRRSALDRGWRPWELPRNLRSSQAQILSSTFLVEPRHARTQRRTDLLDLAIDVLMEQPLVVGAAGRVFADPLARELAALHFLERSEEHTSELQSLAYLVCRLLLEKKKNTTQSSR